MILWIYIYIYTHTHTHTHTHFSWLRVSSEYCKIEENTKYMSKYAPKCFIVDINQVISETALLVTHFLVDDNVYFFHTQLSASSLDRWFAEYCWVPRGSVVKCLTRNPGVLGSRHSRFSGIFVGVSIGKTLQSPSLVLLKPRKIKT